MLKFILRIEAAQFIRKSIAIFINVQVLVDEKTKIEKKQELRLMDVGLSQ